MSERPKRRSECRGGARPCPWFGCRFHLGLDIRTNPHSVSVAIGGKVVSSYGRRGNEHISEDALDEAIDRALANCDTCALDVADRTYGKGITYAQLGQLLGHGLTRERARQIEALALLESRPICEALDLHAPPLPPETLQERAEAEGFLASDLAIGSAIRKRERSTGEEARRKARAWCWGDAA